jgi:DNA-binding transcriptional MocR family regulator
MDLVYGLSQTYGRLFVRRLHEDKVLTYPFRGSSRSGGCPSQLVASCIHQLLANGTLQNHILEVLQPAYARRYRSMVAAIEQHLLPLGVSISKPMGKVAGGYFIWMKLPEPLRSHLITQRATEEEDLVVADGNVFQVQGDTCNNLSFERNIRLCFSHETEENVVLGIERLARVIGRQLPHE